MKLRWRLTLAVVIGLLVGFGVGAVLKASATTTIVPKQVYTSTTDSDLMPWKVVLRYCSNRPARLSTLTYIRSRSTPQRLVLACIGE